MNINCHFDGGYDNINKKNGYGSFKIEYESWEGYPIVITSTEKYPNVESNNEAEYEAFTRLAYFLDSVITSAMKPCTVMIWGDSRLVINQVIGKWKVNASNLKRYNLNAVRQYELLNTRGDVSVGISWVSREEIVKKLGH